MSATATPATPATATAATAASHTAMMDSVESPHSDHFSKKRLHSDEEFADVTVEKTFGPNGDQLKVRVEPPMKRPRSDHSSAKRPHSDDAENADHSSAKRSRSDVVVKISYTVDLYRETSDLGTTEKNAEKIGDADVILLERVPTMPEGAISLLEMNVPFTVKASVHIIVDPGEDQAELLPNRMIAIVYQGLFRTQVPLFHLPLGATWASKQKSIRVYSSDSEYEAAGVDSSDSEYEDEAAVKAPPPSADYLEFKEFVQENAKRLFLRGHVTGSSLIKKLTWDRALKAQREIQKYQLETPGEKAIDWKEALNFARACLSGKLKKRDSNWTTVNAGRTVHREYQTATLLLVLTFVRGDLEALMDEKANKAEDAEYDLVVDADEYYERVSRLEYYANFEPDTLLLSPLNAWTERIEQYMSDFDLLV